LNAIDLRHFWQEHFPNCPPVSYLFKWKLIDRWFRFHSLPESKRYVENDSEVAELIERQNTVLLDVIGENNECILVTGNYSNSLLEENIKDCSALAEFNFQEFIKLPKQDFDSEEIEADEEPIYISLLFAIHNLKRGSLDNVLLSIADWKIRHTFVLNYETKRIFAPYNGGVDVILKDVQERDEFKLKYKDWLSSYPGGL
jgi:hypothetical protein